jgi:hypothetical protein
VSVRLISKLQGGNAEGEQVEFHRRDYRESGLEVAVEPPDRQHFRDCDIDI